MNGANSFETRLFINNEYTTAKHPDRLTIHNPADETLVSDQIQIAGEHDVDDAVAGAKAAFKSGPWATYTGAQRAAVMNKFADLLAAKAAELGRLESMCMGQPEILAGWVNGMAADCFRYYAGWADKIAGESFPADDGVYKIVRYEPLGVCAAISAWNASIMLFAWKAAPALAAGNTIVFKASEKSPLGVLALGELIKEAGFPPGVVQIVTGAGMTGSLLAAHMEVRKISFTGSASTGRKIQDMANKSNMKRCTLELGGKSPALVFPDCDLANAISHLSTGFLLNSGQICTAASRTYVHASIAPQLIAGLKARFQASAAALTTPSANPLDNLGPLADRSQFERVMGMIERAKGEAELVTGGARAGTKGFFVEPTIFLNPKDDAEIYTDEIFGPVSTITTFEDDEDAVRCANESSYGLSATIYTSSISRALRVAAALESGTVSINAAFTPAMQTPFGGVKQSGQGKESGRDGLLSYLLVKTVHISMAV